MNALLIVDIQKEFVNNKIVEEINNYVKPSNYDFILGTIFENNSTSNFVKLLNYNECMNNIKPLINCDEIYKKHTYGIDNTIVEKLKQYSRVDIIGTDIDACIMAICFQLFDNNINFRVLTKYCYTSGRVKNEALLIMKRNFGKAIIEN